MIHENSLLIRWGFFFARSACDQPERLPGKSSIFAKRFPVPIMKRLSLISILVVFLFSACKKNGDVNDLNGSWKLVNVLDKTTNTPVQPPAGSNMDIILAFSGSNHFAGHTMRNTLNDGSYKQSGDGIVFYGFSMTKISEDEFGRAFLDVLHSCSQQSSTTCTESKLVRSGNTIQIISPMRYDLTLKRL